MPSIQTLIRLAVLGAACVAVAACSKSSPTQDPPAASVRPTAASAAPSASAAAASPDQVKAKLQGKWLIEMPKMKKQELVINGDAIKHTVLPDPGTDDKPAVREGTLSITNEFEFAMKSGSTDKKFHVWDRDGQMHIHTLFGPTKIKDKAHFMVDDGSTKVTRDGDTCTMEDYEGKKKVACGVEKRDKIEVFFWGTGDDRIEYQILGDYLVPQALMQSKATKS